MHTGLGVALAYLGRRAEAIREGERGVAFNTKAPLGHPYNDLQLAHIYLLVGEPEKALDRLEAVLKIPNSFSPGWSRSTPPSPRSGATRASSGL
jgi:tetratricopeptide (TPR) repeat protein